MIKFIDFSVDSDYADINYDVAEFDLGLTPRCDFLEDDLDEARDLSVFTDEELEYLRGLIKLVMKKNMSN